MPVAISLTGEIRAFNAEIDFRLRFLHIEIDQAFAARPDVAAELQREFDHSRVFPIEGTGPLQASAALALLLASERPGLLVIEGSGELADAGMAAAAAVDTRVAVFGDDRSAAGDALDLGADPATAVGRMTGVAREIR